MGTRFQEERISSTPRDQGRRSPFSKPLVPLRIQSHVRAVIEGQIDLDLFSPRLAQEVLVQAPAVRCDGVGVPDAG